MKTCGRCHTVQNEENFNWRNKAKGTRNSWCKLCMKDYDKENNSRPARAAKKKLNGARSIQRARDYVYEYMQTHPCVDCGETDFVVLQFDHEDPSSKEGNISSWVSGGYGTDKIKSEIEKCKVRCANCHVRRTAQQFGWWSTTK